MIYINTNENQLELKNFFKSNFPKKKLLKYFRLSYNDVSTDFDDYFDIIYLFKPVLYRQVNINTQNYKLINSYNKHSELTKLFIMELSQKFNHYSLYKHYINILNLLTKTKI